MRGDIVYRVYGLHEGREKDSYFGAHQTVAEAEATIAELRAKRMAGQNWAEQHHNRGFVIREAVVETDFEIPPRPKPRDRYFVRDTRISEPEGWETTLVEVFRRADSARGAVKVCEYNRNYSMLRTFEPFRQGGRDFALVSPHYTGTSVMDLSTGRMIAAEPVASEGFCPVGFYVPDWWDVPSHGRIPGDEHWNATMEWPNGEFGFVWGCYWGDDSSWKLQYLDLSGITAGVIRRDERFGYVELAEAGFQNPCFEPDVAPPATGSAAPPFITMSRWNGPGSVKAAVEMEFDLGSGKCKEWQRVRISNYE